ncbi:flagellar basal-body rod protein FlgF [Moritella yayanosii]|uniref:Flagellar basal-body rod protein FlgF n=1 Tax=Moritella yayanosii TaxID=69539 RepID=A0A330LVZ3_9GAMM|nr:flagellar basal-body rod protein FlgF [Moritella yayanosii]SQD80476.1 flagellar component of cell-proximal portion of basal-body rod FlgF [Moritella yayanosii]
MDNMLYISMSGAKENMNALAIHANNLANVNTHGFKADFEQARSMQAFGEGLPTRVFAITESPGQDFTGGALQQTGNALDVALQGDGWLSVLDDKNKEGYTRSGSLHMSATGELLTSSGRSVLGVNGPIVIPVPVEQIKIHADGRIEIRPQGAPANALEEVDQLKLVNPDVRNLVKGYDGLFRQADGTPAIVDPNVQVIGGALETSNVSAIGELTGMINLQRQFEMQIKMMKTAEENDKASDSLLQIS